MSHDAATEDFDTLPERLLQHHQSAPVSVGAMLAGFEIRTCEIHGEYRSKLICNRWLPCPVCSDARVAELDRAREEQYLAERREKCRRWASIPPRYAECSLRNYSAASERQTAALAAVKDYLRCLRENMAKSGNLVMLGRTGTGKTHLACGLLRALAYYCYRVRYATSAGIIADVMATWHDKSLSERQVVERYAEYELLVIDEIGGGDDRNKVCQSILASVIDARYLAGRPTLAITNLAEDDMAKALGDRAYDRLCDNSRLMSFEWDSHRQRNVRRA